MRSAAGGGLTRRTTQEGKRRVDALRIEFDRFAAFAGNLAVQRQEHFSRAARRATSAATAGVTGSVLLVLLFTGYLSRTIVRPVRRAGAMAGRLAAGDLGVRLPGTGAAEIGALESAFNAMGTLRRVVRDDGSVIASALSCGHCQPACWTRLIGARRVRTH